MSKNKSIALMILLCVVVFGSLLWRHTTTADEKCGALDAEEIKRKTVEYYLSNYRVGNISVLGEDGSYTDYPAYEFSNAQEYLSKFPDCCDYSPKEIDGHALLFVERYLDGVCGFVTMEIHNLYIKNGQIIANDQASGRVWLIDNKYQLFKDPKER